MSLNKSNKNTIKKLTDKHKQLTHTESIKVKSHVQRVDGDWIVNTLMFTGISVPFKYKRKKRYQDLNGKLVNITYYPAIEHVAGFEIDVMNIVRIKLA